MYIMYSYVVTAHLYWRVQERHMKFEFQNSHFLVFYKLATWLGAMARCRRGRAKQRFVIYNSLV